MNSGTPPEYSEIICILVNSLWICCAYLNVIPVSVLIKKLLSKLLLFVTLASIIVTVALLADYFLPLPAISMENFVQPSSKKNLRISYSNNISIYFWKTPPLITISSDTSNLLTHSFWVIFLRWDAMSKSIPLWIGIIIRESLWPFAIIHRYLSESW